jgi:uncharacterized peroxidase-related enzyme
MPEEPISRLEDANLESLPSDLQERLATYLDKPGFIPNVLRAYALRPSKLRAFMDHYDELMLGESELSKVEREMIAVAVSAQNHCYYCLTSHGAALRLRTKDPVLADQIAANYRAASLTARQRAMLDFAYKITVESAECGTEDIERLRAHGFSDAGIWDIVEIAGFYNFTNRLSNALGLRPNVEYHRLGRDF